MHARSRAVPGSTRAATAVVAVSVAAIAFLVAGCSDDVTCTDPGTGDVEPFISGGVAEFGGDRAEWTSIEVFCSADPLPNLLVVLVNGRQLDVASSPDHLGLVASLDEEQLLWAPGTHCSLQVTTDYGFATAATRVPGSFSVTAPAAVSLGDTLTLVWGSSEDADYYVVNAVLDGSGDTEFLSETLADTTVSFLPEDIGMAGEFTGYVEAVSGPFPDGGTEGNITGAGWGFFSTSYYDSQSEFSVTVTELAARAAGDARYGPAARILLE
jgi:hypothetical protein